ncbi:MAG: ribosome biogenesis GTPase YlqF [Clostridia bacterium]|nr:ribosome biogenesis GTPase YlqF [Clostridia bacterium]
MEEFMTIQWFPGHMAKARRRLQDALPLADVVAEIVDARIPESSRNPELDTLLSGKPRLLLLNKSDLADAAKTAKWKTWYAQQGITALPVDCKSGSGLNAVLPTVREMLKEQIESWKQKGMVGRTIRIMVVGIPNIGKSSFINKMAKTGVAKVEDRPGVTRGNQWYTISKGYELLDTPGVLWPKFEDPRVGEHLAFTGAVRDEVLDGEQLAARLAWTLLQQDPEKLKTRYKLAANVKAENGYELLTAIAKRRGMLVSGGDADTERASVMLLDEFRSGKIGRITLELPNG